MTGLFGAAAATERAYGLAGAVTPAGVVAGLGGGLYGARWLLAVWMAFHVAISIGQPTKLVAHLAIFGFIAFLLFRPRASGYFRL